MAITTFKQNQVGFTDSNISNYSNNIFNDFLRSNGEYANGGFSNFIPYQNPFGAVIKNADIKGIISAYAPHYSSSWSIQNVNNNLMNVAKGLVLYKINSDNDEYVKKTLNIAGYNVYQILNSKNDLLNAYKIQNYTWWHNKGIYYNVYKFSAISIYGEFTSEIREKLERIFMNGIRIWYDSNAFINGTDDGYIQ